MEKVKFTNRISGKSKNLLEQYCQRQHISLSDGLERAIDYFLNAQEKDFYCLKCKHALSGGRQEICVVEGEPDRVYLIKKLKCKKCKAEIAVKIGDEVINEYHPAYQAVMKDVETVI